MADAARDGQTALAIRLARHLLAPASGNVAFSPLSVHAALALLAAGARGVTQAQLLSFLGAPSAAELADFRRRVADSILTRRASTGAPLVLADGGIWVDASCGRIKKAFRDAAAEFYEFEARAVSFDREPEKAAEMINRWVKKSTNNLVTSVISPSDMGTATDIVLADAVHFNGAWLLPFSSCFTSWDTFHRLDGKSVSVEIMYDYQPRPVACLDGFKVVKLAYDPEKGRSEAEAGAGQPSLKRRRGCSGAKTSPDDDTQTRSKTSPEDADDDNTQTQTQTQTQYSMFVFLPDKRDGIAAMVDVISAAPGYLYSILPTETKVVGLRLPKFKIAFSRDLGSDLRRLGLTLPFSPEVADLRDVCEKEYDGRPTILSKFPHSAVLSVKEAGSEVAAVNVPFQLSAPERGIGFVLFTADHPFTFLVMEERSGMIVFAGHVLDPKM